MTDAFEAPPSKSSTSGVMRHDFTASSHDDRKAFDFARQRAAHSFYIPVDHYEHLRPRLIVVVRDADYPKLAEPGAGKFFNRTEECVVHSQKAMLSAWVSVLDQFASE